MNRGGVIRCIRLYYVILGIGRAIIDHDYFVIVLGEILADYGVKTVTYSAGGVMCRNDN